MTQNKTNQSGFSVVECILVLIIIVLVGVVGYYVYKNHQETATVATVSAPVVSTNATTYLVVKEWGVKIPLTSNVKDAYYTMQNGTNFAYLSLDSLKSTDCAADQIGLGVITRSTTDYTENEDGSAQIPLPASAIKVGSYHYFYTHPQASCGSTTAVQNQAQADELIFSARAKYIVAE